MLSETLFQLDNKISKHDLMIVNCNLDYISRSQITLDVIIPDGFKKICDVDNNFSSAHSWSYKNIDKSLMYEDHRSQIYAIVLNDTYVLKIGETGNPLGYRTSDTQTHPSVGTKGRLSRYIKGCGTDSDIRIKLDMYLKAGLTVSFYARKCEIKIEPVMVAGKLTDISYTCHKALELVYLDEIAERTGRYPLLNKSRK